MMSFDDDTVPMRWPIRR